MYICFLLLFFFFNDTATTEIYTLSLHDALPICTISPENNYLAKVRKLATDNNRSEEHTSELQSHLNIVCRLLLEKKKTSLIWRTPVPIGCAGRASAATGVRD